MKLHTSEGTITCEKSVLSIEYTSGLRMSVVLSDREKAALCDHLAHDIGVGSRGPSQVDIEDLKTEIAELKVYNEELERDNEKLSNEWTVEHVRAKHAENEREELRMIVTGEDQENVQRELRKLMGLPEKS